MSEPTPEQEAAAKQLLEELYTPETKSPVALIAAFLASRDAEKDRVIAELRAREPEYRYAMALEETEKRRLQNNRITETVDSILGPESARLTEAVLVAVDRAEKAEAALADIKESFAQTVSEPCAKDEVHGSCVPALRAALAAKTEDWNKACEKADSLRADFASMTKSRDTWKRFDIDRCHQFAHALGELAAMTKERDQWIEEVQVWRKDLKREKDAHTLTTTALRQAEEKIARSEFAREHLVKNLDAALLANKTLADNCESLNAEAAARAVAPWREAVEKAVKDCQGYGCCDGVVWHTDDMGHTTGATSECDSCAPLRALLSSAPTPPAPTEKKP